MTDAALRERERAWRASGSPADRDALIDALRKAGDDEGAWRVLVDDAEAAAARAERRLGQVVMPDAYNTQEHLEALTACADAVDRDRALRVLDGRVHVAWERGQRVRVARAAVEASPPKGTAGEKTGAPVGIEGRIIWLGDEPVFGRRGQRFPAPERPRGWVWTAGSGVRIGVRFEGPEAEALGLVGWGAFTGEINLERVPSHGWATFDREALTRRLEERGAFPAKGAKVKATVSDHGVTRVLTGRVTWAGVTKGGKPRVGFKRGDTVHWAALEDVEVIGPALPRKRRCIVVRGPAGGAADTSPG